MSAASILVLVGGNPAGDVQCYSVVLAGGSHTSPRPRGVNQNRDIWFVDLRRGWGGAGMRRVELCRSMF